MNNENNQMETIEKNIIIDKVKKIKILSKLDVKNHFTSNFLNISI